MPLKLTLGDVVLAARYASRRPPDQQAATCAALFERLGEAATHLRITGQAHALYGDGSASSLLLRRPLPALPAYLDAQSLAAFETVLVQARAYQSLKEM